jgi:hypothetical protein
LGAPETLTVVVSTPLATVPGSPEPVSPDVRCHGAGPSSNVAFAGAAVNVTVPSATHTVCTPAVDGVPPATVTEHHAKKFFTVRAVMFAGHALVVVVVVELVVVVEVVLVVCVVVLVVVAVVVLVDVVVPIDVDVVVIVDVPASAGVLPPVVPLVLLHDCVATTPPNERTARTA